jgi:phosphoheptose isomerase
MSAPAEVAHPELVRHVERLIEALRSPATGLATARRWGQLLAVPLLAGQRLLVAGNGGSAAEAQHLTAELVGRYMTERRPLSAIALHAETSSLTAIGNDYGGAEAYARQVAAHGRDGDTLLLLSTSGRGPGPVAGPDRVGHDRAGPQPAGRAGRRGPVCGRGRHLSGAGGPPGGHPRPV